MKNYDKFQLTEEDIQFGIECFFEQIVTEARKKLAKSLSDLSSTNPKISYLVGQPGSGKTTLGNLVEREYSQNDEWAVEIGSDKIATFHRYYDEILQLLPEDCYILSRQFVRPAQKVILKKLMDYRISTIMEATFTKGEKDYETMKSFKDNGYNVEINIMAVDKYESFLSCIERDLLLLEIGYDPRPVARTNHDRMYEPFLQEVMVMQKRGICDNVRVFTRGENKRPKLAWEVNDSKYSCAQEAIISERAKERRKILTNPYEYIERLRRARARVNMMVSDDKMKKNYLDQLEQLEKEFFNELSFDRNI